MSDEVRGSLADAVADWTPPWQRAQPIAAEETAEDATPVDVGERAAVESEEQSASVTVADVVAKLAAGPVAEDLPEDDEPAVFEEPGAPEATVADVVANLADAEDEPEPEDDLTPAPGGSDLAEFGAPSPDAPALAPAPAAPAEPLPAVDDLPATLEAILMVVDEPVGEIMLAQILDRSAEEITATLEGLAAEYTEQGRGFDLRRQAGGWRFYTRDDYAAYVERFVLDGQQARLTKAALETLAVVAYKQPVTRARISGIRGVNCDGVIRTLLSRGLVEECGAEPDSGAHLYRTTVLFLEKLGINSIAELPPLAPFLPDDLDDLTEGGVDA